MKSLSDVQSDMSQLYEELKSGSIELNVAGELANIAGKYLKAEQLKLAREIFAHNLERGLQSPAVGTEQVAALVQQ